MMHLGNCKANGHEDRFMHLTRRVTHFTNSFSLNKKGISFDVSKVTSNSLNLNKNTKHDI